MEGLKFIFGYPPPPPHVSALYFGNHQGGKKTFNFPHTPINWVVLKHYLRIANAF